MRFAVVPRFSESVDPEERKLRIRRVLDYGQRHRELGNRLTQRGAQDQAYVHLFRAGKAKLIATKFKNAAPLVQRGLGSAVHTYDSRHAHRMLRDLRRARGS